MVAIESSSEEITGSEKTPVAEDLFALGNDTKLDKERADEFHHIVAKGLFMICILSSGISMQPLLYIQILRATLEVL